MLYFEWYHGLLIWCITELLYLTFCIFVTLGWVFNYPVYVNKYHVLFVFNWWCRFEVFKVRGTKRLQHFDFQFMCSFELFKSGSGCGSVGRAVAFDTRGPRFNSRHRQNFIEHLFIINCIEKRKINKKRPGMAHFKKKLFKNWPEQINDRIWDSRVILNFTHETPREF